MNAKCDIISPDGFTISHGEGFQSITEAEEFFITTWLQQYAKQGYYSSNNGKIALTDLRYNCKMAYFEEPTKYKVLIEERLELEVEMLAYSEKDAQEQVTVKHGDGTYSLPDNINTQYETLITVLKND